MYLLCNYYNNVNNVKLGKAMMGNQKYMHLFIGLTSLAEKHNVRKVGLGKPREATLAGGGRSQGVGKFLQGVGAGDSIVWVRDVGPLGVNGK